MNVFAYVGSPRENNSHNLNVTNRLLDNLSKINENLEIDVFTPNTLKLNTCKGCANCFRNGTCPLDKLDGFDKIKDKVENADLIILASPVYAHSVSAHMKNFIDRLSYWLHLLKLAGKPAVVITGASSNGNFITSAYLNKIVTNLGAHNVKTINFTSDFPKMVTDDKFMKEDLYNFANEISDYMNNKKDVTITDAHRILFNTLKADFTRIGNLPNRMDSSEFRYWKETKMLDCNDYEDLINLKNKKFNIYN